ncbi:hypothetical protein Bbelb_081280 [Branchiostoma belcheri]|nr:hypothetical protein Bbelb_081280 [Branchiostoma belcheri]
MSGLTGCETARTDTMYRYRWEQRRLAGSRFTFAVQADNDAHVALSAQRPDLDDMYEIVIGGWANLWSVIRRSKQGKHCASALTLGINSPTKYRTFWITWSSDGTIAVGKGGKTQPFMQWRDPDPLPIAYAGYSTGWGSTGRWKFCHNAHIAGGSNERTKDNKTRFQVMNAIEFVDDASGVLDFKKMFSPQTLLSLEGRGTRTYTETSSTTYRGNRERANDV